MKTFKVRCIGCKDKNLIAEYQLKAKDKTAAIVKNLRCKSAMQAVKKAYEQKCYNHRFELEEVVDE